MSSIDPLSSDWIEPGGVVGPGKSAVRKFCLLATELPTSLHGQGLCEKLGHSVYVTRCPGNLVSAKSDFPTPWT
jgi:hypothetical protein